MLFLCLKVERRKLMKNMRKVIAGIMSALLLITTGTMNGQIVSATDSAELTEISTEETTVYKGEAYNFGERQTNWYSTNESPDSSNVDAYSLVDGYEMAEASITSTATLELYFLLTFLLISLI